MTTPIRDSCLDCHTTFDAAGGTCPNCGSGNTWTARMGGVSPAPIGATGSQTTPARGSDPSTLMCTSCGTSHPWDLERCPSCGETNRLYEQVKDRLQPGSDVAVHITQEVNCTECGKMMPMASLACPRCGAANTTHPSRAGFHVGGARVSWTWNVGSGMHRPTGNLIGLVAAALGAGFVLRYVDGPWSAIAFLIAGGLAAIAGLRWWRARR